MGATPNDSFQKRGGYITGAEESVIPVVPDGPAPGALGVTSVRMEVPRLTIHSDNGATATVTLGGVDISRIITAVSVRGSVGAVFEATLELAFLPVDIDVPKAGA